MKTMECIFCGKRPHEVTRMVSNDARGSAICVECVMCCMDLMEIRTDEQVEPSVVLTPVGQALAARLAGGA